MILDKINGRFKPTPKGQKTIRMKQVEKILGKKLEDDFYDKHIIKKWGQKKIANSWGVSRNLIFSMSHRGGRRSWVEMLGLKVRRYNEGRDKPTTIAKRNIGCEVCGKKPIERAHWIPNSMRGSSKSNNIVLLCPNHHTLLDQGDKKISNKVRVILLYRETKKVILSNKNLQEKAEELYKICDQIINTRK